MTPADLQAFADAWNRHDVDALMSFMTADCVFETSAGTEVCGTRHAGRDAVRRGFAEVFETFPDAHWGGARHFVAGDRGVSEWTFTGTRRDGTQPLGYLPGTGASRAFGINDHGRIVGSSGVYSYTPTFPAPVLTHAVMWELESPILSISAGGSITSRPAARSTTGTVRRVKGRISARPPAPPISR